MRIPKLPFAVLAAAALSLVAVSAFQDLPIPEHQDPGGPHAGQPEWCQNTSGNGHSSNCACEPGSMEAPQCQGDNHDSHGPDSYDPIAGHARCKVSCRKDACRCRRQCAPTAHLPQHRTEGL